MRVTLTSKSVLVGAALLASPLAAVATSDQAAADDWGCQVLLCLSNPGGPMQFGACVPPITKLYKQLAKGGGFPSCNAKGTNFSYHGYGFQPFEPCKDGRRLMTGDGMRGAYCHKTVSLDEYFGGATVTNSNLDPGDSFVYEQQETGDNGETVDGKIIGVNDNDDAVRRQKPHYLRYSSPTTGNQTLWW